MGNPLCTLTLQAEVQFPYGWYYTMVLTDGTGFGAGGVAPVQQVGGGPSDCLSSVAFNTTQQLFSFNASGTTGECDGNFRLTWDGPANQGPYNFSVVPLDGGYMPWVVPLQDGTQYYDWQVNLTAGSYFTVMLNDRLNWGAGGVGGVYQVTTGKNPGCATQTRNTSALYSLPAGLNIDTLPSLQPITSSAVPSSNISLSTGAIVGIAVGGAVGAIAIAIGVYLVYRCGKRRNWRGGPQRIDLGDMDIDGDGDGADVRSPIVEPFMSQTSLQHPIGDQRDPGGPHRLSHSQPASGDAQDSAAARTDHRPVYSLYSNPPPSSSHGSDNPASSSSQSSRPEKDRTYSNLRGSIPFPEPTRYISRSSEGAATATFSGDETDTRPENMGRDRIHRHIDGGLLETSPESQGDVELPPLYTDINRNVT